MIHGDTVRSTNGSLAAVTLTNRIFLIILTMEVELQIVNDFVFAESNPHADTTAMDSEEQSLDLLYRHKKIYGTGPVSYTHLDVYKRQMIYFV